MSFQGKKNIYVCQLCFGHIVTVDTDHGTTPFMIECKVTDGCRGLMESSFYRVFDQRIKPSHEWYKPEAAEVAEKSVHIKQHVEMGGLLLREVAV